MSNPSIDIASRNGGATNRAAAQRIVGAAWTDHRHGADAVDCVTLCAAPDAAVHRLQHRTPGVQPVVWQHRPSVLRARAVSWRRRLYRRGADLEIRRPELRAVAACRGAGVRADIARDRRLVRSLHQDLLRHADAGVRHAVPLLPVQVLQHHRRRSGHARAASAVARHGMARRQDRIPDRSVLLLCARSVRAAGSGDVAHYPVAVRPASARDPRERRQGRLCRRADFSDAVGRVRDLGGLWRHRRNHSCHHHRFGRSRTGVLDPFRQSGVHGRPRRQRRRLRGPRSARWSLWCCRIL